MACDNDEEQCRASESSNSSTGALDKEMEPWLDKFTPFPETTFPESSATLVTLSSVLVGVTCGIMVNGSNIYLGLKTGWTSSANLLGVHFQHYTRNCVGSILLIVPRYSLSLDSLFLKIDPLPRLAHTRITLYRPLRRRQLACPVRSSPPYRLRTNLGCLIRPPKILCVSCC